MKNLIRISTAIFAMLLIATTGWAQSNGSTQSDGTTQSSGYTMDPASSLVVKGTSTLHDWEAKAQKMSADVTIANGMTEGEEIKNPVENFSLQVEVKSLESGKGKMNRKMYDALKQEDHPQITFNLTSAEVTDGTQDNFTLQATGMLNIAGTEKEVTFPVKGTATGENSYRFEGSYSLNMENYDVDPPSMAFGTIRTGEEVDIEFDVIINKKGS